MSSRCRSTRSCAACSGPVAKPLYLSGYLSGGHGETSIASDESPWEGEAEEKIVGRYLTPFLAETAAAI